ncbi:MAG: sigma-70 family RNA polymerase sigma factor [Planctomycetes bacterium]|nr:sigma-70 family RNA polymerase sigma factor [Planctomycetota bacterium]
MDTSVSLLERAAHSRDAGAWQRLTDIYAPLLERWLSRYEIHPPDADDVVQEVLLYVADELPRFEHNGRDGAFRSWLRTALAYRVRKFWRGRNRQPQAAGGTGFLEKMEQLDDPHSGLSRQWDRDHNRHVAARLLELIRPRFSDSTWRAFEGTVLDAASAAEVAERLGISTNAVCIAKSRVLKELRREGRGLIE